MLGRALKAVRLIHSMSQVELAQKLAISNSFLSELENGKKNATFDLLRSYSQIFDVPMSTFISYMEALEGESEKRKGRAKKLLQMLEWANDESLNIDAK